MRSLQLNLRPALDLQTPLSLIPDIVYIGKKLIQFPVIPHFNEKKIKGNINFYSSIDDVDLLGHRPNKG